jgi:hypothetical protein
MTKDLKALHDGLEDAAQGRERNSRYSNDPNLCAIYNTAYHEEQAARKRLHKEPRKPGICTDYTLDDKEVK